MFMNKEIYIIGGGLAGCILGYTLSEKYNQSVFLVDDGHLRSASKVAAGIFNPITGKRMVKTWMADDIFPYMIDFYKDIEIKLGAKFLNFDHVLKPFDTISEQNEWSAKTAESYYGDFIRLKQSNTYFNQLVEFELGGIEIQKSGWLDCISFMECIKKYFVSKQRYVKGKYLSESNTIESENLNFQIPADDIIVNCTGFQAASHPLWKELPWQLAKGEVITIFSPLELKSILNKSVFVCPTSIQNEYKVGATYVWNDISNLVTTEGIDELKSKLKEFAKFEFNLIKSEAEVRPTVKNRKPFLGNHPNYQNQYIFNGFGSKTVSMGPYFANELAKNITSQSKLTSDVDVKNILNC